MIRWITQDLGTARIDDTDLRKGEFVVVDVRDLVDGQGNLGSAILAKIDAAADSVRKNRRVVICCDYGISRSNAIAAGVLVRQFNYDFDEAVKLIIERTGNAAIRIDLLGSVRRTLRANEKEKPSSESILITGGTSHVGAALVNRLARRYKLVVPDCQQLNLAGEPLQLDLMVRKKGVETVVHLAHPEAHTNASMGETLVTMKNILDVCKENRLNLLYLSNWTVYSGYDDSYVLANESLPLRPRGTEGETKALCETLVTQYRNLYNLNVFILRSSRVYGPGSNKPRFIHAFCQKALKNETIFTHQYRNGLPTLDLLHADDVVNAIERAIEIRQHDPCDLNIGSGVGISTFAIAEMIKEICGSHSAIKRHEIDDFVGNIAMDITRAQKTLNWRPTVDLKRGLEQILKNIGWKEEDRSDTREKSG